MASVTATVFASVAATAAQITGKLVNPLNMNDYELAALADSPAPLD